MTYQEARDFIHQSGQYGCVPGLDTITQLMHLLGNPQEKLRILHIAGTNGKGSTAAFIASILACEGCRVGRYHSPAVFSYREIIQITRREQELISGGNEASGDTENNETEEVKLCSENITKSGVAAAIQEIKAACEAMVREGYPHPTSFEIETAMAMLYFVNSKVDFAVIEVGMGGKMDATNIFQAPVCSVITSISMDHMQFLGDTLGKIAGEKAGIIKRNCPVITCVQEEEVMQVLEEVSREQHAPLTVSEERKLSGTVFAEDGTDFTLEHADGTGRKTYRIHLLGEYQVKNALLALKVIDVLRQSGYLIREAAVIQGLKLTRWSGRFEIIGRRPLMVIDGAHNQDAALMLRKSILRYFNDRRKIFIIGVLADKDYHSILKLTAPLADVIFTVTSESARALPSDQLAKAAMVYHKRVIDAKQVRQALLLAKQEAAEEDVIIAFGSLSFLGEFVNARELGKEDE